MSDMLPILEELADCTTNAQRVEWLLCAPPYIFHREHMKLRRILRECHHQAGLAYVEAKFAEQTGTRMADGSIAITIRTAVHVAEIDLKISARKGGA